MRRVYSAALVLPVLFLCIGAGWNERNDATGDWGGVRSRLESDYGVHIDLDYTAETFVYNGGNDPSYRGNLDLVLTINMEKLGFLRRGTFFVYGQHAHGGGISDQLGLILPVSNLEAEPFTQLSEFWFYQQFGRVRLRLGKQDANRDFGNPRFGGNFVNSSFGVLPGIPMPSFPAPGLGAAAFIEIMKWLELRGGVYEGSPKIGSFGASAFADDAGIFSIAAIAVRQNLNGREAGLHQLGVWTHNTLDRSGLFAVYDLILYGNPRDQNDKRSVQIFVRGDWSSKIREPANEITAYVGGGLTAHAFFGEDNTVGLGAGWVRTQAARETFIEAFFKLREIAWLTFEPDIQLYFTPDRRHLIFALRTKLKL